MHGKESLAATKGLKNKLIPCTTTPQLWSQCKISSIS
jgi:hypothetical protein